MTDMYDIYVSLYIYIYIYIKWRNNVFFVSALKSVPLEIIGWFFSTDPANFSASDKPRIKFPSVWESAEKIKNLKLTKMTQNRNGKNKMPHELFCLSYFPLRNRVNQLRIKFCIRKANSFFKKNWMWYLEKQPNLKTWFKFFLKNVLWLQNTQD